MPTARMISGTATAAIVSQLVEGSRPNRRAQAVAPTACPFGGLIQRRRSLICPEWWNKGQRQFAAVSIRVLHRRST